jgi:hypothetical protein
MNTTKRFLFTMMIAAAFAGCSEDEGKDDTGDGGAIPNNTVTVAVENGASYSGEIDTVKLAIDQHGGSLVIASLPYAGGNFTITLPASVDDEYLDPMDMDDLPSGITTSNRDVKGVPAYLYAYKSGQLVGEIYRGTAKSERYFYGYLLYLAGDVSITGTGTDGDYTTEYRVNGEKGWNMVYVTRGTNLTSRVMTTKAPAGAKWYFDEIFYTFPMQPSDDGNE